MIRFSEIAIKGAKTRKWFTDRLVSHIDFLLKAHEVLEYQVIKEYSRVFVKSNETKKVEEVITALTPGAVSTSEVFQCSSKIEDIQLCVKEKFFTKFKKNSTFAVQAKRTGKHPYSSVELGAKIGEFILDNNEEKGLKVDLTTPEYKLKIEVRDDKAYVFDTINRGLGGLPVGSQGKVLVLVSGEREDISNIIQLYKRGAVTQIYSLQKNSEMNQEFKESITRILNFQPQLSLEEKEIYYVEHEFDVKHLLDYYTKNECLGLAVSKAVFNKLTNELPVSLPIFVPHLVTEIDEEEISKVLATIL